MSVFYTGEGNCPGYLFVSPDWSLTEQRSGISHLGEELKLCNDYLEMQKIRFENALICLIDLPEAQLREGFVPHFSIQSLIGNAIKHNEVIIWQDKNFFSVSIKVLTNESGNYRR